MIKARAKLTQTIFQVTTLNVAEAITGTAEEEAEEEILGTRVTFEDQLPTIPSSQPTIVGRSRPLRRARRELTMEAVLEEAMAVNGMSLAEEIRTILYRCSATSALSWSCLARPTLASTSINMRISPSRPLAETFPNISQRSRTSS